VSTQIPAAAFPAVVQRFFSDRLSNQQNASPRTVASYRDAFRLLLRYLEDLTHRPASQLTFADIDAPSILGFLRWLEKDRGNSIASRNARLAAIRSFTQYAATEEPVFLPCARRIAAIPMKRGERPLVGFLSREEVQAVLNALDPTTWSGRRDHALFTTLYNSGARVSEIIGVKIRDVILEPAPSLTIHGKGRKQRVVPLWKSTARLLKTWIKDIDRREDGPLFPGRKGQPLSRSGVEERLRRAIKGACHQCPSLEKRRISPHSFRHTTAMHMLQSGVDITVISLWLGHESPSTTHIYIEADLQMKQQALGRLHAPDHRRQTYRPSDKLVAFLQAL
jgi:integrase/recombinase XerD